MMNWRRSIAPLSLLERCWELFFQRNRVGPPQYRNHSDLSAYDYDLTRDKAYYINGDQDCDLGEAQRPREVL